MNISNSEPEIASLASNIKQLEAEQNLWKENIIWLKRYFDDLKQEFKNRPEIHQIEHIQQAIAQLTQQVVELQQHFNHLPSFSNSLEHNNTTYASNEFGNFGGASSVEQQQTQQALLNSFAISVSADFESEQNEIDVVVQQQQNFRALSDEEFKVERMLLLLDKNVCS